jgi:integrase
MTTGTVLEFKAPNPSVKFIKVPIYVDWAVIKGKMQKKQFCVIGIKQDGSNLEIIHNISDFILSNWSGKQYNTQKKHCENLVVYLNWVLENRRELKVNSFADLTLDIGVRFLNSFVDKGVSRGTVHSYERTLKYLFLYLAKKGIIEGLSPDKFVEKEGPWGKYFKSPFENVLYPAPRKVNREHLIPLRYIPLFLEIAILEAKPIAFGIYMLMFGGLRPSEAVNTRRAQLLRKVKDGTFLVDLKDQNFRPDLKNSSGGGYVKKPRNQIIFQIHDWGHILFREHCELYKPTDGSGALFVNANGKAMTYASFYQYFKKVKRVFIEVLKHSKNATPQDKLVANSLERRNWNGHIGRGTYTNLLAEEVNDPYDLAFLRGDGSLLSSLTYLVGTTRFRDRMNEKFQSMHEEYIPRLIERKKN